MKRYFRNSVTINSLENIEIDEGSLWELKENNLLVLVDKDQYITCWYDSELFKEVEM